MKNRVKITGFEGYEIDTEGNVWSSHRNSHGAEEVAGWHKLKNVIYQPFGYHKVAIKKPCGIRVNKSIHRMLAEAFIPNPENKPMACHKDGDVNNNVVSNIYWGTAKDNQNDKFIHGTSNRGIQSARAKLSEKQVRIIKHALSFNIPNTAKWLAKMCGVGTNTISNINLCRTWKHIII